MGKYLLFLALVPCLGSAQEFCVPDEKETIMLLISNRVPIEGDVRKIVNGLRTKGLKISDINQYVDLKEIISFNHSFSEDFGYILKISVLNKSHTDRVYNFSVEAVNLSNKHIVSSDLTVPKENFTILVAKLHRFLCQIFPKKKAIDPIVISASEGNFSFPEGTFSGLRKGDEIKIRYAQARRGLTESYSIVEKVEILTNGTNLSRVISAKDLSKSVKPGDTILGQYPQRNRFSFTLLGSVVAGGTMPLQARDDSRVWNGTGVWLVGLILSGEYERFLVYQLLSTTSFGINVDGMLGTFIFTGIGYRIVYHSWEFVPYVRMGVMYNSLILDGSISGIHSMQGAGFRFGINFGMSFMKRLGGSLFLGFDIGIQWYPLSYGAMLVSSQSMKPQWKNSSHWSYNLPLPSIYPYLGLKSGWTF